MAENEEFLLKLIHESMQGIQRNIEFWTKYPDKDNPEFHNGILSGLQISLGTLQALLRVYERKLNGTYLEEE